MKNQGENESRKEVVTKSVNKQNKKNEVSHL